MLENYSRTKRQNLVAFWRDSLSEKKLLRLLSVHYAPERRPQTGPAGGRDPALLFSPARAELHHLSDSESEEEPDAELDAEVAALSCPASGAAADEDDLFCLGTQLGVLERTGHRVLQVAQVLRSLSFEPENAAVMAASAACLRFLLLCAHCRWGSLSSSARDTLGNIAGDVVLRDAASDRLGRLLVHYVARGVQHSDRSVVLASLEVLNKLAQDERNEEPLVAALDTRIVQTVCTYLSLHDILLLISSLECLLGLTSLGEDTCRAVARAPGAVSMLVSLVTVEVSAALGSGGRLRTVCGGSQRVGFDDVSFRNGVPRIGCSHRVRPWRPTALPHRREPRRTVATRRVRIARECLCGRRLLWDFLLEIR